MLDAGDADVQPDAAEDSLGLRDTDADPVVCSEVVAPVELDGESVKKLADGDVDAPAETDACVALGVAVKAALAEVDFDADADAERESVRVDSGVAVVESDAAALVDPLRQLEGVAESTADAEPVREFAAEALSIAVVDALGVVAELAETLGVVLTVTLSDADGELLGVFDTHAVELCVRVIFDDEETVALETADGDTETVPVDENVVMTVDELVCVATLPDADGVELSDDVAHTEKDSHAE